MSRQMAIEVRDEALASLFVKRRDDARLRLDWTDVPADARFVRAYRDEERRVTCLVYERDADWQDVKPGEPVPRLPAPTFREEVPVPPSADCSALLNMKFKRDECSVNEAMVALVGAIDRLPGSDPISEAVAGVSDALMRLAEAKPCLPVELYRVQAAKERAVSEMNYQMSCARNMRDAYEELQRKEREWQPIETAPKHGWSILAWAEGWKVPLWCSAYQGAYYHKEYGQPWPEMKPTHWFPVPLPPRRTR